MAKRKNSINIDFSCFATYAEKLDRLGANLQDVIGNAMEDAGKKVADDTEKAMAAGNLPAGGMYSTGATENSIIKDPKVEWHGSVGEIGLGFDKTKPGAGGFLITGTPKMRPDAALAEIYSGKRYENTIRKQIKSDLQREIDQRMGG